MKASIVTIIFEATSTSTLKSSCEGYVRETTVEFFADKMLQTAVEATPKPWLTELQLPGNLGSSWRHSLLRLCATLVKEGSRMWDT